MNKIIIILFILSLIIHLFKFNQEGRTWDEQFKIDTGMIALNSIRNFDFSNSSWQQGIEHPIVAKYIYGLTGFSIYHTITSQQELNHIQNRLLSGIFVQPDEKLIKAVDYDFTYARLLSVIFNSITVILTFYLAKNLFNKKLAIISSFILMTYPRFIAMGRLVTYESLSAMLYLLAIIIFIKSLKSINNSFLLNILTALIFGLAFWTRYNNIHLLILLYGLWIIWQMNSKKIISKSIIIDFNLLLIPIIGFIIGIIIWPYLWINFPTNLLSSWSAHSTRAVYPSFYHLKYYLVTTPVIYLITLIIGMIIMLKRLTLKDKIILWYLISTLGFFIILSSPTGATRYMYVIYPATAIISSIAVLKIYYLLINKYQVLTKIFILMICCYQTITLLSYAPYYLDYYNEIVGGISGAVAQKYEYSWWGEGQREAGLWMIKNAKKKSSVSLALTPKYVLPLLRSDLVVYSYNENIGKTDYVLVSAWDIKSNKNKLHNYKLVYQSKVKNIGLVFIYKKMM